MVIITLLRIDMMYPRDVLNQVRVYSDASDRVALDALWSLLNDGVVKLSGDRLLYLAEKQIKST